MPTITTITAAARLIAPLVQKSTRLARMDTKAFATKALTGPAPGRLQDSDTALFICDVQERFRSVIHGFSAVADTSRRLSQAAAELKLPTVVTEQYPKALGHTVSEVADVLPESSLTVAKTDFSMVVPEVREFLGGSSHVRNILLAGVETHVCVLQTTIDLVEMGFNVHIITDGVSSQRVGDRAAALARLSTIAQGQVFISSGEMALFQMLVNTSHPSFKAISAIVKGERPEQLPPM
jgi:nicotinamidase-related amidase